MPRVNELGYVERRIAQAGTSTHKKTVWRDWFFVKHSPKIQEKKGYIHMQTYLSLPKEYIGKRIKLKIEVIE